MNCEQGVEGDTNGFGPFLRHSAPAILGKGGAQHKLHVAITSSVWHLGHERNGGASWLVRIRLCTSISDSVDANARGRTSTVASANSRMEHNDMPFAHEWTMDRSRAMIELKATHRNDHDPGRAV